jgi:hypothetical protein
MILTPSSFAVFVSLVPPRGELRVLNCDGHDGGMRPTKGRIRDLGESGVFGLPSSGGGERPNLVEQRLLA